MEPKERLNPVKVLHRLLRLLPESVVLELKRLRYQYLIKRSYFRSEEMEFQVLDQLIKPGDTVVDIGANVGHYTLKMAKLVGPSGRVFGFEPISRTFDLLSSNVVFGGFSNVSLFNCAITDRLAEVAFSVPEGNYYQSHLSQDGDWKVMGYPLSCFMPPLDTVSFLKIDAEGCDEEIVLGASEYVNSVRPIVMVEVTGGSPGWLANLKAIAPLPSTGPTMASLFPVRRARV